MTAEPTDSYEEFKDYCLILQVHPEADAGMIEAAYWHLAKRYNEQADTKPLAKAHLDDLNEAYSVLGTPAKREAYFHVRNAVLGVGALPSAPVPKREPPPLAVMEKQRPHSRPIGPAPPRRKFDLRLERFVEPSWQNTLLVLISLTFATSMLTVSANLAVVLAPLVLSMLIGAVPLALAAVKSPMEERLPNEPEPSVQSVRIPRPRR